MSTVQVDVVFPIPEGWGICLSCEMLMSHANLDQGPYARGLEEYPPDWQADFHRLSDMILAFSYRYQNDILIRIWDPRSLQGLWKSLRHGVRRYPAFIVNGKAKVTGWNEADLDQHIRAAGAMPLS